MAKTKPLLSSHVGSWLLWVGRWEDEGGTASAGSTDREGEHDEVPGNMVRTPSRSQQRVNGHSWLGEGEMRGHISQGDQHAARQSSW